MSVTAVIGGQFGSEGKGLIVGHVAKDHDIHVRVGAANAGHTVYTYDHDADQYGGTDAAWEKHVMQQLPCAAYANPDAVICIGPGALISPAILDREIDLLRRWREARGLRPMPEFYVDHRALVIDHEHEQREQETDLAERIGSTSTIAREGIGAAQAARVMREPMRTFEEGLASDGLEPSDLGAVVTDVAMFLARANAAGRSILLEGTQGTGLSLTTGFFPYVTSRNVTAAGLAADCGVAPNAVDRVIGVFRSFPIRVAGPSGPFYPDSREIAWEDIEVDPESERTTVTKKVRRVATFSNEQLWEACKINGVTEIAFTFADYLDSRIAGVESLRRPPVVDAGSGVHVDVSPVGRAIQDIERITGTPVTLVGTGPHSVINRDSSLRRLAAA